MKVDIIKKHCMTIHEAMIGRLQNNLYGVL